MKLRPPIGKIPKLPAVEAFPMKDGTTLVSVDSVIEYQIVATLGNPSVVFTLYRFEEGRGLVYVDRGFSEDELIANIRFGSYDPVEPDHPLELHDL
jgi:hypothetical protein